MRLTNAFFTHLGLLLFLVIPSNQHESQHHHRRHKKRTTTPALLQELRPDTRTLDQLYHDAKKEVGRKTLIVYAGGDTASQQNKTRTAFEARFPDIKIEIIVDFSKFHDARIDFQLNSKTVVPDVVQLQTLQDFPRWKAGKNLLHYKTIDWNRVNKNFKDTDGAFTAVFIYCLSNNLNTEKLDALGIKWPTEARDYLRPEFKNNLIMTYPNDDDAVLFLFKQIVDKYGFKYLRSLVAQNVTWVRGTDEPLVQVNAGKFLATMTSANSLQPKPGKARFVLPNESPFVIWGQRAAILKDAPNPTAAKLYMSWLTSLEMQNSTMSFSVRDDVAPPPNYNSIWSYKNGDPLAFENFMTDRESVERFKNQVSLIVGEPVGPNPNGNLGTHPRKAVFELNK